MEKGLKERIEHKQDTRTTDQKLFDELFAKTHELQDLVAKYHADADSILCRAREEVRKTKEALEKYKEATKK